MDELGALPGTLHGDRTSKPPGRKLALKTLAVANLLFLLLPLLLLLAGCSGEPLPELEPIPAPDLSAAVPAVREQIAEKRAAVDAAMERAGSEPAVAADAWGDLGLIYLLYDFLDAAGVCFDNARRLDPGDFRWIYLAGYLRQVEGRLQEAVPLLERTAAMEPDYLPAHLRLGRARLELGLPDRAEEHFQDALGVDPESAAAFEGLGRAAAARGDDGAAVASFRRALELEPEASGVRYALGQALRRQGDVEAATRELEQAGDVPTRIPDPLINPLAAQARSEQFYSMQGAEALEDQDFESAAGAFRGLLEQNPGSFPGYQGLATALAGMGDVEGARETLERALVEGTDEDPESAVASRAEIHRQLAALATGVGDEERARRHYGSALELEPEGPAAAAARVRLGDLLARARRFEEALAQYDRALEELEESSSVRVRRAMVLVNLQRGDEAVAELERAVEVSPEDPVVRQRFAEALEFLGRTDEAAEQRRRAEELAGEGAQGVRLLLREAQRQVTEGDFEAALESYRQATEQTPELAAAHGGMARVLGHLGRYEEAVAAFERALELQPRDPALLRGRVTALVLGQRWGEARVALNHALRVYPREKDLALLQVRLLSAAPDPRVRDGALALEVIRRVLQEDRGPEARQAHALALAESGRTGEASEVQRGLIREVEGRGSDPRLARLRQRLTAFEANRAWQASRPEEILEGL